jgi:hypothetical protein
VRRQRNGSRILWGDRSLEKRGANAIDFEEGNGGGAAIQRACEHLFRDLQRLARGKLRVLCDLTGEQRKDILHGKTARCGGYDGKRTEGRTHGLSFTGLTTCRLKERAAGKGVPTGRPGRQAVHG